MGVPSTTLHGNPTRVAASAQIKGSAGRLWAILLVGGTTASSLEIKDALTDTGTQTLEIVAPFTDSDASAQSSFFLDLTSLGGQDFSTGIFAVLAGTGAIAYVWFD